ncbi:MAG: hypothetical protein ACOCT9_00680 [archaeon]
MAKKMQVFIDTEIWAFARKKPNEKKFKKKQEYIKAKKPSQTCSRIS